MSADPDYAPPFWYRGRHLQTLWGPLLRNWRRPPLRRERLHTPDGDFLDLDWLAGGPERGPLILILHGLEGSARSHYARGLLRGAGALGWRAAVMHFRSCSGEVNRLPKLYHSGETSDLEWVIGELAKRETTPRIGLVGISLGGNVALKWLGEQGDAAPGEVAAAAAISTPFDLAACARELDRGFNRAIYTESFLRTMKAKIRAKRHLYDDRLDVAAALRARTFTQYDRLFINAINDPFMPAACLPTAVVEGSRWLEAAFVAEGGHVGFLDGPLGGASWAERRALAFLARHLLR